MVLSSELPKTQPLVTWELLPDNFGLPDDPVENIQQPPLAAALTAALGENGLIQPGMLTGSNFALVATLNGRTVVKAPDWFYVPHVSPVAEDVIRRSYTQHREGEPVAIVMEFLSAEDCGELSLRDTPPYGKLYFYEQILKVPTYVTYDPYGPTLQVRRLEEGRYVLQTADPDGRFDIPELQLKLGMWKGERLGETTHWLRWWNQADELLLWSSEQVSIERQKTERLATKLRELGIDPDTGLTDLADLPIHSRRLRSLSSSNRRWVGRCRRAIAPLHQSSHIPRPSAKAAAQYQKLASHGADTHSQNHSAQANSLLTCLTPARYPHRSQQTAQTSAGVPLPSLHLPSWPGSPNEESHTAVLSRSLELPQSDT